jgi:uncharacterized membrane protein/mono/diheme cytochrome c family protein
MQLLFFTELTGRFHPVIVHLPIGILLLACFFELLSSRPRLHVLKPAVPVMIFWGMISAVLAVLSGLALSQSGEYEEELIDPHEWAGISVGVISIILYVLYKKKVNGKVIKSFSLVTLILIMVTGHLGGSITHGSDYLTAPLSESDAAIKMKPIPDIQQAAVYTDVVQPLLQARCYKCHGENKKKGKLRLDGQEHMLKGGESGKTIIAGKPDESELIERLLLPLEHEDHMPPKGRTQLTREQINVLHWWVSTGADFNKKVHELKQTEQIKPALLALQEGTGTSEKKESDLPTQQVAAADTAVIRKLISAGVMILPVARNSNYLMANFVTAGNRSDTLINMMAPLKKQLVSLKMDGAPVNDTALSLLSQYQNLRRLQLSNTRVTDQGLDHLAKLKELRSLNLVSTAVSAKGLVKLKDLKELKDLYLYKTTVSQAERGELQKHFPGTNLDFGNYTLPMLPSDTAEVKIY